MFTRALGFLSLVVAMSTLPARGASPFCDGYAGGYKAGYCYGKYSCLEPMAPMCPMPRMGENTYQDGYNRGFLAGLARQR
jgi:hypothetical protein